MRKLAALSVLVLSLSGCAVVSSQYRLGARAELNKQFEDAIAYYEKASLEYPRDPVYRVALQRAKVRASIDWVRTARELAAEGKKEEALAAYEKAQSYNPRDPAIGREARLLTTAPEKPAPAQPERIEFPIKLKTKDEPLQLKFPVETSIRSIFQALGKAAGIGIIFDENFRDVPYQTDLSNLTFEQALKSICTASKNFYRIIDERSVLVIPDNAMKRLQYEVNCIRTFYLANITAQEVQAALSSMLRSTTRVPNIVFDKNLNSLTIRSTPQEIELVEKLLRVWDKPKGEVVIDLEIMEVSRLKLRELGVSFDSNTVGMKYGDIVGGDSTSSTTSGWHNLASLDFSKAANFSISLPTSFLDLLESDGDTKIIAQPRLPGVSDEEMRHLVGQKIPIPQTSFYSIAAGGVSQQPVTSFTQQDVGIEIKIKPTIHRGGEVTLVLEIKVTSIGGTGYAGIPIINTREIKNTIRLRDGETSLLAGLLKDEERRTIKGIPGLKDIPLLGRLFSSEDTTIEQSDVILTVTPYIIRTVPITAEDAKPLWVDVDTSATEAGLPGLLEDELMGRQLNPGAAERSLQARNLPGAGGAGNSIQLLPANFEAPVGRTVRVSVNLRSDQEIGNLSLNLSYNPQILSLSEVTEGGLVRQLGEQAPFLKNIDNNSGICAIGFSSPQVGKGLRGGGTIATLVFEPKSPGECMVSVTGISAMGANGTPVTLQPSQSRIVVR